MNPERRRIQDARLALESNERNERSQLLSEHNAKYAVLRKELQDDCIKSGVHKMRICQGELAGPNFVGLWPYSCFNCGRMEWR